MDNKCEWKGKILYSCKKYDQFEKLVWGNDTIINNLVNFEYCPFCGAFIGDIIIKRSKHTWVALYKGDHIICVNPGNWWFKENDTSSLLTYFKRGGLLGDEWLEVNNIEFTDELAKVRPEIINCSIEENITVLYGVDENGILYTKDGTYAPECFRVANVFDLHKEAEKGESK